MDINDTLMFVLEQDKTEEAKEVITTVHEALKEKGYNPINQIVGYIISGDPTYITNHNNARIIIQKLERDEILEVLLNSYLAENK